MNTQLKKVLSDLLVNHGSTALVVCALVIGLWGVRIDSGVLFHPATRPE